MQVMKYLPIAAVLTIYLLRMLEVNQKRVVVHGPVQERATFLAFMLGGLIAVFGGIVEYVLTGMKISLVSLAIGILLAVFSFAIRRAAISALGRFWSLHIEIREDHQFVRSGPFRWMRHPTYFSMILELLSAIAILHAVWSGAVAFLIFIPALMVRLSKEEKAMVEKFGTEYESYQRSTPILLPTRFP